MVLVEKSGSAANLLLLLMSAGTLLVCVGPAPGYLDDGHMMAAQWALDILKASDLQGRYAEVYDPNITGVWEPNQRFTKTLIQGAADEDHGVVAGNERSFRHYYDPRTGKGVKYSKEFDLWTKFGGAVKEPKGGQYSGAKQWARNGDGFDTVRNWRGAILAYDYSNSSRQEAYWRLGHVVHLIADMAEPDHATNTPHAGSGYQMPRDLRLLEKLLPTVVILYFRYKWAELGVPPVVGFEELVDQSARKQAMSLRYGKPFAHTSGADPFDDCFDTMARTSLAAVTEQKLILPIGLWGEEYAEEFTAEFTTMARNFLTMREAAENDPVFGSELFDYLDSIPVEQRRKQLKTYTPAIKSLASQMPRIHYQDSQEVKKYEDLAEELLIQSAYINARLMQDFYEIVNPPPFVRSVRVTQRVGGVDEVKYEAAWRATRDSGRQGDLWKRISGIHDDNVPVEGKTCDYDYLSLVRRELNVKIDKPLELGTDAVLRIEFGPYFGEAGFGEQQAQLAALHEPERIEPGSLVVNVGGHPVSMQSRAEGGRGWWQGTFRTIPPPEVREADGRFELPLVIEARDFNPHSPNRQTSTGETLADSSAYQLDSDPASPAKALPVRPYNWYGYEVGQDTNHKLTVSFRETTAGEYRGGLDPDWIAETHKPWTIDEKNGDECTLTVGSQGTASITVPYIRLDPGGSNRLSVVCTGALLDSDNSKKTEPASARVSLIGAPGGDWSRTHGSGTDRTYGRAQWRAWRRTSDGAWLVQIEQWACPWPVARSAGPVRFLLLPKEPGEVDEFPLDADPEGQEQPEIVSAQEELNFWLETAGVPSDEPRLDALAGMTQPAEPEAELVEQPGQTSPTGPSVDLSALADSTEIVPLPPTDDRPQSGNPSGGRGLLDELAGSTVVVPLDPPGGATQPSTVIPPGRRPPPERSGVTGQRPPPTPPRFQPVVVRGQYRMRSGAITIDPVELSISDETHASLSKLVAHFQIGPYRGTAQITFELAKNGISVAQAADGTLVPVRAVFSGTGTGGVTNWGGGVSQSTPQGYMFEATRQEDGTWLLSQTRGNLAGNTKMPGIVLRPADR